MSKCILPVVALILALCVRPAHADELEQARLAFPGGAYVVIEVDGQVRSGAWGRGAGETPFTPSTPVSLYSVTKPMTAVLAARLAVAQRIDVDAPIGGSVTDLPEALRQITLRQLLTHTAGIRHYRRGEWLPLSQKSCATAADALPAFINDAPGPMGRYAYSSFGYVLASHVMETTLRTPFADLLQREVLGPSGMTAVLWHDGLRSPPNGYEVENGRTAPARPIDNSCKSGGGALIGSAEDLARFGAAVASGRLIPAEVFAEMLSTGDAATANYGAGWGVSRSTDGHRLAVHSGSGIGGVSALVIDRDTGRVAAVVANADGDSLLDEAKALLATPTP